MAREQETRERFFGFVSRSMKRVELLATPVALTSEFLETTNPNIKLEEINFYFPDDIYATWAEDETQAATNLNSDDKRRKFRAGQSISYFRRDDSLILFVKAVNDITDKIDKELYYQRNC